MRMSTRPRVPIGSIPNGVINPCASFISLSPARYTTPSSISQILYNHHSRILLDKYISHNPPSAAHALETHTRAYSHNIQKEETNTVGLFTVAHTHTHIYYTNERGTVPRTKYKKKWSLSDGRLAAHCLR